MLLIKSYSYTTLTSVTAFNFLGVPLTMIFARIFFRAQYCIYHIIGVLISLGGFSCVVISEISQSNDNHTTLINMITGDMMAFFGITLLSAHDYVKLLGPMCYRRRYFLQVIHKQVF